MSISFINLAQVRVSLKRQLMYRRYGLLEQLFKVEIKRCLQLGLRVK